MDTVAAAAPATPVQLAHACRQWGFSSVVPASWGDELIATDVIQRCATRDNRPAIQCSCPLVSDRLARHGAVLDDSVFWLVSPPVAVARYLREMEGQREIHLTYAGGCPGANDASIDERISARDLLAAIAARGIDIARQPTVFDDVIPPDRRRHASTPAGLPEHDLLWSTSTFRLSQPGEGDFSVAVAQLLLREERVLVDLSRPLGCVCRLSEASTVEGAVPLFRSPTPVVVDCKIDLSRPAPFQPAAAPVSETPPVVTSSKSPAPTEDAPIPSLSRSSVSRVAYRRQSVWRRQSPRPGVIIARPSAVALAERRVPLLRRAETRWVITALLVAAAMFVGVMIGRRSTPAATGSVGAGNSASPGQLARSRLP